MLNELETARYRLRVPSLDDAATVTALVQDPRIYRMVSRIPPEQTIEQTGQWILGAQRGNELGIDHTTLVLENGAVIGAVGAHRAAASEPFEIGYWLGPEAWGKGAATEVAGAIIAWLEERDLADTLVSGHFEDNPASGRVLAKLGFKPTHSSLVYCAGRGGEVEHVYLRRNRRDLV